MANLRIVELKVVDSRTIRVSFTEDLDPFLTTANVTITANTPGVLDGEVLSVSIKDNELTIEMRPLTPFAAYFVEFKGTSTQPFRSLNGTSFILEDGKTNKLLIAGPEEAENPIRDTLTNFIRDSIYNIDNITTINKVLNNLSTNISRGLHDIGQAKNDNYLSILIADEEKVRGKGPTDRLNEEGAFEVVRVAKRVTGSTVPGSISFTSFPSDVVTLLRTDIANESLVAGAGAQTFDSLTLTTNNTFVTKLKKVQFRFQNGDIFDYDISSLGYKVKEPKYDTDFASTLLTLTDSQFKLNSVILEDASIPVPAAGDVIVIDYEYKDFGKFIDADSVQVTQVLDATREVTPPLLTEFSLKNAPIVTAQDVISSLGGVTFLDPNSVPPFSATHPAFVKEIPLRFEALPARIGEYAVDYTLGRVFVFGENADATGTGNFPPVATYKYRNTFSSRLDYTYDPETNDLAANPLRDLRTEAAKISFDFEGVLEPDVDFVADIHTEELNERIDNRLISSNTIQPLNFPITNVFRVFNETSGEVYGLNRFSDNKIVFNATVPPRIFEEKGERAAFTNVSNELLLVDEELINLAGIRVFKILLSNNKIISNTEDIIGSSFNSSVGFSRTDIFTKELYYDGQTSTVTVNINKLSVGRYQIDYQNGIVYVGVAVAQTLDLGTINYKKPVISPANPHVLAVDDIFHQLNPNANISKRINVLSFADGAITPSTFDISDERFLNADTTMPYILSANTITVTDDVKNVRHIFDLPDLLNNEEPTDFGSTATASGNIITVNTTGIQKQEALTVDAGLIVTISSISAGISVGSVISVVRTTDSVELLDGYQTVVGETITLAASSGAVVGDPVIVIYNAILNGGATPIVDYNRGDYFVDYTYLADEILISYEHGDNVLDFRNGDSIDVGDTYFVTYRVGALRDALVKNFGSLVNIPILNTLDTSLARETYRDAVAGALQTFTKGPTVPAIKQLVASITKIDPELKEALFEAWSLGVSFLFKNEIEVTGGVTIAPAKFDGGALITSNPGQTITFPVSSNLRLEEGTFETWVIPEWDGLDNDADITFCDIAKNSVALSASNIFIGASSFNPTIVDGKFTLNRADTPSPAGLPSAIFTNTGMFIFYDIDVKRWKVLARDTLTDGYVYSGDIQSSGEVYDAKFFPGLAEVNDVLRSGTSKIFFKMNLDGYDALSPDGYNDGYSITDGYFPGDGYVPGFSFDGFSFMADNEHYIFDFAEDSVTNRFSLYKDGRGYLNFRVYDRGNLRIPGRKNQYKVSADIQDWAAGQQHHVAASWRLNTSDRMDEMHLFIDGFEVPNIIRFGGRPVATSTDRFRTVKPELLAGVIPKNTITSNDLSTTAGSAVVTSASTNFTTEGILPGDTIDIKETGFGVFTILLVSGNSLTLTSAVASTIANGSFSVNPFSVVVSSQLSLFKNIAVSILSGTVETEIPGLRATIPGYEISKNVFNQDVLTILGNAKAGDSILVRTLGLNHRRARTDVFIWGNTTSILKTQLPPPINLDEISIVPILLPLVPIGPANATLGGGIFTATGLTPTQPSNATEGRRLSVRVTGGNVDFTTLVSVTIFGTTAGGPTSEVLTFDQASTKTTINKFRTITSATVVSKPLVTTKDSTAVEIREAFSITEPDGNSTFPIVRFSYKTQVGSTLAGDGSDIVSDVNGTFFDSDVGNSLVISSPGAVAGTFTIAARIDSTTIQLTTATGSSFSGGTYEIFNVSLGRSGFQNGFFVLETAGLTDTAFPLKQGFYEFDYSTYLEVPFDPVSNRLAYVGSDFEGNKQTDATLDEMRILNKMITDVRVGEPATEGVDFVTTDFTSLNPFTSDKCTLSLLHFDSLPLENSTDFYVAANKEFVQAGDSVNSNFNQGLVITDKPFILDNKGLLTTVSEGSIEFWVSPRFDTANDPNFRFYFDASGTVVENITSTTAGVAKVAGSIQEVLSVRLATDVDNTGINFFSGGSVESDFQTIKLGQALPFQQTPVKINYTPRGSAGNRMSIFKDPQGFVVFNVVASGIDYQVRHPVFWERDSWHRVKATYKFNRQDNRDEIRLFIDGEERNIAMFGAGLLFGQGFIFGQQSSGVTDNILVADINFTDILNQLFIGSDFLGANSAQARIDNLRLSNVSRNPTTIGGQPKDINFSTNLDVVFPVVPDAFSTFLLDFDRIVTKNTDFALLKDPNFGVHDFTLNIIDSFGIVTGNGKVDQLVRTLINTLKPAQSRVLINLVR